MSGCNRPLADSRLIGSSMTRRPLPRIPIGIHGLAMGAMAATELGAEGRYTSIERSGNLGILEANKDAQSAVVFE
jgi:hypothetical protein